MDRVRFNSMIAAKTAKQFGLNQTQVLKIIKQYHDAVFKAVNKLDFPNITREEYIKLTKRGIYVPGLGRFVFNWKIIEGYQKKYKTGEYANKD